MDCDVACGRGQAGNGKLLTIVKLDEAGVTESLSWFRDFALGLESADNAWGKLQENRQVLQATTEEKGNSSSF